MTTHHVLMALLIGGIGLIALSAAIVGLWQEWRQLRADEAEDAEWLLDHSTVGRISERMDVPKKLPALRTRHSRTLP